MPATPMANRPKLARKESFLMYPAIARSTIRATAHSSTAPPFQYQEQSDTFVCPAGQTLTRKQLARKDRAVIYAAQPEVCGACALKGRCTARSRRFVTRHLHEAALQGMDQRATSEIMRLRRSTVEHPFATLKYRIFGHPRFLLRGLRGAQTEMSLAVMAHNIKRMFNILGGLQLKTSFSIV